MKNKIVIRMLVDVTMTVILLFLMTYKMIGKVAHEWIGIAMFVLFVLHHILNNKWSRNILKGKYAIPRILQTVLVGLILITMIGSMFSGIVLAHHVFNFLTVSVRHSFARNIHIRSAYWGFVLMSLHLGIHWNMMIGMTKKIVKNPSSIYLWIMRGLSLLIAAYGVICFIKRHIGSCLFLKIKFAFFDFNEPIIKFLADYIAIMGLFVFIGHYLFKGLKKIK